MFDVIFLYVVLLNIDHQDTVVALIVTRLTEDKGLFWLICDIILHRKTRLELINRL